MNKQPTILITGANGFIGSTLVQHFKNKGWKVVAMVRNANRYNSDSVEYIEYDLAKPINETVFQNVDYLIHCAYIPFSIQNINANQQNFEGTRSLLETSRKNGLKKNIFLSSMSAQVDALSYYGRQKFAIEQLFNTNKDVVVRPGLVLGKGGLIKRMSDFIKSKKTVPLIGRGNQPIQTIQVNELAEAIEKIIEKDLHGTFTVAEPTAITYKEFYKAICSTLKVNALFIPIPYFIASIAIDILNAMGFAKGISKENLLGLKNMKAVDTKSDLEKIGVQLRNYKISLESITNSN